MSGWTSRKLIWSAGPDGATRSMPVSGALSWDKVLTIPGCPTSRLPRTSTSAKLLTRGMRDSSLPTKSEPRRLGFLSDSMLWRGDCLVVRPAPLCGGGGRFFPAQALWYQKRAVFHQHMQEPEALGDGLGSWMSVSAPAPSPGQAGQDQVGLEDGQPRRPSGVGCQGCLGVFDRVAGLGRLGARGRLGAARPGGRRGRRG